tara:strand:- start:197 stop:451 length:255 start_codon:yes stop_codon:yes gene_type:complete
MVKVTINKNGLFTSMGKHKAGDVVDIPQSEIDAIEKINAGAINAPKASKPAKKTTAKKKRARNKDGTLKADDPSTPENEAWEDA